MKRRNDNFWRRLFVVGATAFIIILFLNLLFFPLNKKEPSSLNWFEEMVTYPVLHEPASNGDFWGYIGVSIGISGTFTGAGIFGGLVSYLFEFIFNFIGRTIRIPFYEPRNYHWENEYLKEKKTIWTILKNGILFVLLFSTGLTIFAFISNLIQGKQFIWDTFPQAFLIVMGIGLIVYIFLLLVE